MNFIKHHQRGIALAAAFAFFWLIQVGNFPLKAETDPSPQSSIGVQPEQPGSIEMTAASGQKSAKKSPLLPIIIGVVVVGAVAAVLILVVFKTKYDIRGSWNTVITWPWGGTDNPVITFSGDKDSGILTSTYDDTGTYTVDGKDVSWRFDWDTTFVWTGKFTDKDTMSGTINWPPDTATWTATRVSAAAATVSTHKSWKK